MISLPSAVAVKTRSPLVVSSTWLVPRSTALRPLPSRQVPTMQVSCHSAATGSGSFSITGGPGSSGSQEHPVSARTAATTGAAQPVWRSRARDTEPPFDGRMLALAVLLPRRGEQRPGVGEQLGQHLGLTDDRHEVRVATPPWDDVLMQVARDAGAGDVALVHADVETVRAADSPDDPHRGLREPRELIGLLGGEVRVVRDVAVRTDHQVTRVVRVAVEHREDGLPSRHHQTVLGWPVRRTAERATSLGVVSRRRPVVALHVGQPVRRPQPFQSVRRARHKPALPAWSLLLVGCYRCPGWVTVAAGRRAGARGTAPPRRPPSPRPPPATTWHPRPPTSGPQRCQPRRAPWCPR